MVDNHIKSILLPQYSDFKDEESWNLKIICSECNYYEKKNTQYYYSSNCRKCLIRCFSKYRNDKISVITNHKNEKIIEDSQIMWFFDYLKNIRNYNKILSQIKKNLLEGCKTFNNFNCMFFQNSDLETILDFKFLKMDPLIIFNKIKEVSKFYKKIDVENTICLRCIHKLDSKLNDLYVDLKNSQIVNNISNKPIGSFNEHISISNDVVGLGLKNKYKDKLLKKYFIGKENSFQVSIFKRKYQTEVLYNVEIHFENTLKADYYQQIVKKIAKNLHSIELENLYSFQDLFDLLEVKSMNFLSKNMSNLSSVEQIRLSFLSIINTLNLKKLFPLLIDNFIEEIFLDQPNDEIYLNHQIYGRCRTNITLNSEDIDRIKTFIRLYSRERLDIVHPSIKSVIKNDYFHCRFSIDVSPLHLNHFCLDVRKLNKNIFTLPDLIQFKTITPEIAAFLFFCVLNRINLTATGETDTGKTTLINSLDLISPKEFRKIYVENAVESLDELKFSLHQVKYKSQSLDVLENSQFKKSNLIQTLLHRTPDIIFLGEILTEEECKAMFHCLSAGLRGFQTIHSRDIESLINRFIHHFQIDTSCLDDLDLIILMKKLSGGRKVVAVSEIIVSDEYISVENLFEFNPISEEWILKKNLFDTNSISRIRKYESLKEEDFNLLLKIFKEFFDILSKFKEINTSDLVSILNKVGYLAKSKKYNELIKIWKKIKKLIKLEGFKLSYFYKLLN